MTTTTISAPPSTIFRSSSSITKLTTLNIPPPNSITFRRRDGNSRFKFSNCFQISKPDFKLHPYIIGENQSASTSGLVSSRLETLVSEFQSLPQPIDRVKRLLDYAMVLPQFNESSRVPANRVAGCAAEVWLEVEMDEIGLMRFKADSDSEITKGFCSCLIFLLDGAYPEEVLKVKAEDLADMNVGLPVRSRVNSWNNVLISMQERTKNLLDERGTLPSLDPFPLVVPADSGTILEGKAFVS